MMFDTTCGQVLGASIAGAGAMLGAGVQPARAEGRIDVSGVASISEGLRIAASFPLIEAIQGRRARRFAKGATITDGPLAYASTEPMEPPSELQQMLLLSTIARNTGWANLIPFNPDYAPKIPNHAGAAGGPFHGDTPGPYKKTELVRESAVQMGPEFTDCVTVMAQYIQDTFGRFPATVPAIHVLMYLQAHKLDTGFYDEHFGPGAYLGTHKDHDSNWT